MKIQYYWLKFVGMLLLIIGKAYSQQSFFNVPNSHITEKKQIFFQQQTNITQGVAQLNQTFCYGLGKGFEIGLNLNGVSLNSHFTKPYFLKNYDPDKAPLYPFLMMNAQKAFIIHEFMEISGGIQYGSNMQKETYKDGIYAFTNYSIKIDASKSWIATGFYYANNNYFGKGDRLIKNSPVGFQFGIEQFLYKEKISLIIDYFSGIHAIGETVIGIGYDISPEFNISLGYQHPNPNSAASQSVIIEFTYNRITKRKKFARPE